ncbi:MFS transporter [Streptomyces sp. NPDC002659]|uniref:MFS transporter n=1 Tax=Streptomyces sp. NPDC002659 TaxID=3364656 RepID=UPI0036BE2E40
MKSLDPDNTGSKQDPGVTVQVSPWQSVDFKWYYAGTVTSWLGSSMAPVALAFAVLAISESSAALGLALAARSVPFVVFLIIGGALADRLPRSRLLKFSNLGSAITQGIVAVLLLCGSTNLSLIIVLELANGAITAFTTPATAGIVPELVDASSRHRANSVLSGSRSAIRIAGGTTAGIMVATAGGGWAIALDAASFLFAAFCMTRMQLPQHKSTPPASLLTDIRDGWAVFRATTWVWVGSLTVCIANCIQTGIWTVLGPTTAEHTIGAAAWGMVLSAGAVGILASSAVMYRMRVRYLLRFGHLCLTLGAIPLITLGLHPDVHSLIITSFAGGLGIGALNIAWDTSMQTHVPTDALSRVSAFDNLGAYIAMPIGQIAAGPLATSAGTPRVEVLGGILFALMALLPLAVPAVRTLRHE